MNGRQQTRGQVEDGYEIITSDSEWFAVHIWRQGMFQTKLFLRDEHKFGDVLAWINARELVKGYERQKHIQ